jgi:hypothetical protein
MKNVLKNTSEKEFQIGVLRNIQRLMPKHQRQSNQNWVFVRDFLFNNTGNSVSNAEIVQHCKFLGIDPFFNKI